MSKEESFVKMTQTYMNMTAYDAQRERRLTPSFNLKKTHA
jgi:hypothetical protein